MELRTAVEGRDELADTTATDVRLLAVAERLFAQHGIDAVSLRSITIEAADQPLALAVDGEAKANVRSAEFSIRTGGLRVYSPLPPVG